jgi:hypothetical protein
VRPQWMQYPSVAAILPRSLRGVIVGIRPFILRPRVVIKTYLKPYSRLRSCAIIPLSKATADFGETAVMVCIWLSSGIL